MKRYIIDNDIIFTPEIRKLQSRKNGAECTIQGNSSRCLELLLQRQGTLVSQAELTEVGWGPGAFKSITNATYYQCFVNLRKNFKDLNYDNRIITTVRQKGILIHSLVSVEIVDDENIPTLVPDNGETVLPPEMTQTIISRKDKNKINRKSVITFSGAGLVFIFVAGLLLPREEQSQLRDFVSIEGKPPCFYFNKNNKDQTVAEQFMTKKGYGCHNAQQYYITSSTTEARTNVLICDKSDDLNCKSISYILR